MGSPAFPTNGNPAWILFQSLTSVEEVTSVGDASKKIVSLFAFGMLVTAGLWFNSDDPGFTRNMAVAPRLAADINGGTGACLPLILSIQIPMTNGRSPPYSAYLDIRSTSSALTRM